MTNFKKNDRAYRIASIDGHTGEAKEVAYVQIASIGKKRATVHSISRDGKVSNWSIQLVNNRHGFLLFETEAEAWAHRVK